MKRSVVHGLLVLGLVVFVLSQSMFIVPERSRALVLQLGEPMGEPREPGLNFKLPFLQSVVLLENRIMMFTIDKGFSLTLDSKNLEIDSYVCWRIVDPLLFIRTFRAEKDAEERLHRIVFAQLRAAVGAKSLQDLVGGAQTFDHDAGIGGRNSIMQQVLLESDQKAKVYGVSIVDVRIKRADLPNRQAIFERMKAERERMANEYRATGQSNALKIRAEAEFDRDIILAEAEKASIVIRGQAEARAMETFVGAIAGSGDFYEFAKSLDVYQKAFVTNSRIVLSNEDPFLQFFK